MAAPTAGLHFTPEMLEKLAALGVEMARVTLHVGLGTFAPLRVERVDEVRLHRERYSLPAATAAAVNQARSEGRRIVAVGTTVVRTLESAAAGLPGSGEGDLVPHSGGTEIFISPGFQFRIVDALLTNFHLPRSSLLMLVCAFAGRERVLAAYREAVREALPIFQLRGLHVPHLMSSLCATSLITSLSSIPSAVQGVCRGFHLQSCSTFLAGRNGRGWCSFAYLQIAMQDAGQESRVILPRESASRTTTGRTRLADATESNRDRVRHPEVYPSPGCLQIGVYAPLHRGETPVNTCVHLRNTHFSVSS